MGYLLAGTEAQAGDQCLPPPDWMKVRVCADKTGLQGMAEHSDPGIQLRFPGTRQPPLRLGLALQRPAHVDHGGPSRSHGRGRRLGMSPASRAQAGERAPLLRTERGEHEHVRRI